MHLAAVDESYQSVHGADRYTGGMNGSTCTFPGVNSECC